MAVENVHSARTGARIDRIATGGLFHHGERCDLRSRDRGIAVGVLLILLQYKINPALLVLASAG